MRVPRRTLLSAVPTVSGTVFAVALAAVMVASLAVPARAITFGRFDGRRHPNVGVQFIRFEGEVTQW